MTTLIADCETDGFLDEMTRLWCVQIGDADTDEVTVYADLPGGDRPLAEGIARLRSAKRLVFHNGISFDVWAINRFFPRAVSLDQIYDTLVVARLFDPSERYHALEDWGHRLKLTKGKLEDFSKFTPEMVEYARQDIRVTRALYRKQQEQIANFGDSVALEHKVAHVIVLQERNGFRLNIEKAATLEASLRGDQLKLEKQLQETFPPIERTETFTPKANNSKLGYKKGVPFTKRWTEVFNPGSRQQIAERLKALGWKPKKFTETGQPQVDEEVLANLDYPEAKLLDRYFRLSKQLGQLSDGDNGWLKLVKPDGRVYGRVNPNGAVTGRMSHFKPNIAQADKKDLRMREVWEPRPGWKQVGCDAEGIEARMLGHYLWPYDGGEFAKRVVEGKKEDGSDVHSVNFAALKEIGCPDREGAKRELYAFMYGAGDAKLGWTIKDAIRAYNAKALLEGKPQLPMPKMADAALGKLARDALARSMRGSDKLIAAVKRAAKVRKWVRGLDGRRIYTRSPHSALNTLLQGGGAIVMKMALVIFHYEMVPELGLTHGLDFAYCANVHDEVQIEAHPTHAETIGKSFADAIRIAGERLKVRCPLAGAYAIGNNWKETH